MKNLEKSYYLKNIVVFICLNDINFTIFVTK